MANAKWSAPGHSGDFNKGSNWTPNGIPVNADVTLGDSSTVYTVTDGNNETLTETSVFVGDDAILEVTGDGTLLKVGSFTGKGTVDVNGSGAQVVVTGNTNTSSGDTLYEISNGGTLAFDGAVGAQTVTHGHSATVDSPVVTFNGTGNTLDLTQEGRGTGGEVGQFFGQIDSFAAGDNINVAGNGGDSLVVIPGLPGDDVVEVVNGKNVEEVLHFNNVGPGTFELATPATGNPNNVDTIFLSEGDLGCFLAGTLVSTPRGQVVVEDLKYGDIVLSADGREVPVIWVGKQTVSTRFADPLRVLPIRIKAGALDENVPSRDLLVSPDHAMLVQGVLIHAGAMVNGNSIVRETRVPEVFVYYHLEAEDHSIILAENAPAETFIDNIDRLGFDNWAEHQALYPEGRTVDELPYPRAKSARQIPVHVRVKLVERVHAIGADISAVA